MKSSPYLPSVENDGIAVGPRFEGLSRPQPTPRKRTDLESVNRQTGVSQRSCSAKKAVRWSSGGMSRLAHRVGDMVRPTCYTEPSSLCMMWRAGRNISGPSKRTVEEQDMETPAANPPAAHSSRRGVATASGCRGTPASVPWHIPGQVRGRHGATDSEQVHSPRVGSMKVYPTAQAPQDTTLLRKIGPDKQRDGSLQLARCRTGGHSCRRQEQISEKETNKVGWERMRRGVSGSQDALCCGTQLGDGTLRDPHHRGGGRYPALSGVEVVEGADNRREAHEPNCCQQPAEQQRRRLRRLAGRKEGWGSIARGRPEAG